MNDLREGKWQVKEYYGGYDPLVSVLNYRQNKLHDTCYYYNSDGKLGKKITYYMGRLHGPSVYYGEIGYGDNLKCNNCQRVYPYANGYRVGEEVILDKKGDTLFYQNYSGGSRIGESYSKDTSGVLRQKITRDGEKLKYDKWGRLYERAFSSQEFWITAGDFIRRYDSAGRLEYRDTVYQQGRYLQQDRVEYENGKLIREEHWYNKQRDGRWFKKDEYDVVYKNGEVVKSIFGFIPSEDYKIEGEITGLETMAVAESADATEQTDRMRSEYIREKGKERTTKADSDTSGYKGKVRVKI
ncbi:MAG TPA: hypothetical protein VEC12_13240, partial [Bacteroidia bacterium]|nr:hypothetical protein [Bacteroidia bacterium]